MHQSNSTHSISGDSTTWSKEQITELLEQEDFKYQKIDLPYGLQTGGKDRSATRDLVLPADLTGKSVLDIGSFSGYFCFEALKRGAGRTLGIEYNAERARQARLLADCLNLPAEFQTANIETAEIKREWDYVLCLNVLHHLRNPLAVLEKLLAATRVQLVLEVASLGRHDLPKLDISPFIAPFLQRAPLLFVADPRHLRAMREEKQSSRSMSKDKKKSSASIQKIYMTRDGVENLLHWQPGVDNVEIVSSPHRDRFIARVQKRHINRLLVVAGPVAAGKSTLIEMLQRNKLPQITECLGWGDPRDWTVCNASKLQELKSSQINDLIVHYNLLRPWTGELSGFEDDEPLQILHDADEIFVLTLGADPSQLRTRYDGDAKRQRLPEAPLYLNKRKKRIFFDDEYALYDVYRQWFEFVKGHLRSAEMQHEVVAVSDQFQTIEFQTPGDWIKHKPVANGKEAD